MISKITLQISADSTNKLFKDKGFCLCFVFTADSSWLGFSGGQAKWSFVRSNYLSLKLN